MRRFFLFKMILLVTAVSLIVGDAANAGAGVALGRAVSKAVTRGAASLFGERGAVAIEKGAAKETTKLITGAPFAIAFVAIGYGDATVDTANASKKLSPSLDISRLQAELKTKGNRCVLSYGKDGRCWPCIEDRASQSCPIIASEEPISIYCDDVPCKAKNVEEAVAKRSDTLRKIKFSRPVIAVASSDKAKEPQAPMDTTKASFPARVLYFKKDGAPADSVVKAIAEEVERTLKTSGAQTNIGYSDFSELGKDRIMPRVLRIMYSSQEEERYKAVREVLEAKFGFLTIERRKKGQLTRGLQVLLSAL